jgi:predicted ATPase/DNA-binding winged helix-turn-helix (wHTH) protein
MEPQVFAVLRYLLANWDRVIPKEELLEQVWGDQFVSESALTTRIKQARKAVGDDGKAQAVIKTAHGQGYRFIAEIKEAADEERRSPDRTTDRTTRQAIVAPGEIYGRAEDLEQVRDMAKDRRLVTLLGPGGVGKTHLLRHSGAAMQDSYVHGCTLVELAPVKTPGGLGPALLEALGANENVGMTATESAARFLTGREVLLLIDNAEHLISAVAELCHTVLSRCPQVTMLVSSRLRLQIAEETLFAVGPLALVDAVEMFVERANSPSVTAARPDIHAICKRLDGVPLALELIAARSRLLSVGDLSSGLRHHLSSTGPTDADRHSSVEAALGWSLDSLSDGDRAVLADLTVFAGAFDINAAGAVCGRNVTDAIVSLCEHSLVTATPSEATSRFQLLEPVRMFASGTGVDLRRARAAHAAHYIAIAEQNHQMIIAGDIDGGFEAFSVEWPNVRAVFRGAISAGDLDAATSLVLSTAPFGELRSLSEVREWFETTVELAKEQQRDPNPELLACCARLIAHAGELAKASDLLAGMEASSTSSILLAQLFDHWYAGRTGEAMELVAAGLEAEHGSGGYYELAFLIFDLYAAAAMGTRADESADRLVLLAVGGGQIQEMYGRFAECSRAWWDRELHQSVQLADESVVLADRLRHSFMSSAFASFRTIVIASLDDAGRAVQGVRDAMEKGVASGGWSIVAADLAAAAKVLSDLEQDLVAAQLLGARDAAGYHVPHSEFTAVMTVTVLAERLGARLEPAIDQGRHLTLEQAARLALRNLEDLAQ